MIEDIFCFNFLNNFFFEVLQFSVTLKKANNPIHCALSLVGEPIMYPHIGEFLDLLHGRGISSYLVTNATFPDAIKTLPPVTQLYTSIDGSTKEELKV